METKQNKINECAAVGLDFVQSREFEVQFDTLMCMPRPIVASEFPKAWCEPTYYLCLPQDTFLETLLKMLTRRTRTRIELQGAARARWYPSIATSRLSALLRGIDTGPDADISLCSAHRTAPLPHKKHKTVARDLLHQSRALSRGR